MKRKNAPKQKKSSTTKLSVAWIAFASLLVFLVVFFFRSMQNSSSINILSTPSSTGFGKALSLDNTTYNDTYLQKSGPSLVFSHNPFTVETWIKLSRPSTFVGFKQYPILSYTRSNSPIASYNHLFKLNATFFQENPSLYSINFSAYIDNPKDNQTGNNFVSANSPATLKIDDWNHVAVVSYSKGDYCKLEIYLNGVLSTTSTSTYHQNCQISTRLPQDLLVGKPGPIGGGNSQDYFSGQLDDVRISSFSRYTSNFAVPTSTMQVDDGTMVLYNFDASLADITRFNNGLSPIGTRYSYVYRSQPTSPLSSCLPRPACLDAKPACKIPISPNMCAPSRIPAPSSGTKKTQ